MTSRIETAAALLENSQVNKALTLLEKEVESGQRSSRVWFLLGVCHFRTKKFTLAESEFRQAAALNPNDPLIHYYLGLALERQQCLQDAILSYRSALSIDPGFAKAHEKLKLLKADTNTKVSLDGDTSPDGERDARGLAKTLDEEEVAGLKPDAHRIAGKLLDSRTRRKNSFPSVVLMPVSTIVSISFGVLFIVDNQPIARNLLPFIIFVVVPVLFALQGFFRMIAAKFYVYNIYENRLDLTTGMISTTMQSMWLFEITRVWFRRGLMDLFSNNATIIIRTDDNFIVRIKGFGKAQEARQLFEEIRNSAIVQRRAMKKIWV